MKKLFVTLYLSFLILNASAQSFFTPSDSLNKKRLYTVVGSWTGIYGGAFIGLDQLWYKNYERTSFHFFDDSREWLQMDKAGHAYTNYFETKWTADALRWSGMKQKKAAVYGTLTGLLFQTTLEMFDAYSAKWGFSVADMGANAAGAGLFLVQELIWKEQRICLKFSSSPSGYKQDGIPFAYDPTFDRKNNLFGDNFWERAVKDYNTQTYWLSFNIQSLTQSDKFPKWLNIDLGYGADGMLGGFENKWSDIETNYDFTDIPRVRQFYISPDIDFTKIKTKSHFLKTVFEVINIIKVPAPALMLDSKGKWKGYLICF